MANKTPNIDYICVIREKDGKTAFETVDIPTSVELVSKLEAMVENENVSVLDMQAQMNRAFPQSERKAFNYVSPYSYWSSFIGMTSYPATLTFEAYNQNLANKRESLALAFEQKYSSIKEKNPADFQKALEEHLRSEMAAYRKYLKMDYLHDAKRYICAYNYTQTLGTVRGMDNVRMYSTDTLGWSSFTYKVTEDIVITLGTNFCYGSASYFNLNLRYKGVDILPYSYMVKYYFANLRDLIRYTRLYDVTHDSWNVSFAFVEEAANLASSSPREFLTKWVLEEVKEMVKGLHGILEDPAFHVKDMVNRAGRKADVDYLSVRNMYETERGTYAVYPNEMTTAIQAEKITGALTFLENLSSLSKVIPDIDGFITEIKDMAVKITPTLDAKISEIMATIALRRKQQEELEGRLEAVKKALEPLKKAIDLLFEKRSEDKKDLPWSHFEEEYSKRVPRYANLKEREDALDRGIAKLITEIRMREGFAEKLKTCRKRVSDAGLVEPREEAA